MMVISPWARPDFVDHTVTDQSSVIRFVEDNWLSGQRIGQGSFDAIANSIAGMFDFTQTPVPTLMLSETTGAPVSSPTAVLNPASPIQRSASAPGASVRRAQNGPGF
jgi:phospholipase C